MAWTSDNGANIISAPSVANGVLYFGSEDGNVYAVNAKTGAQIWKFQTTTYIGGSSPAVANGVVYVGSSGVGIVYALSAKNGALLWQFRTGDDIQSSPTVVNGIVYIGSMLHRLWALDANTGALLWDYQAGDWSVVARSG